MNHRRRIILFDVLANLFGWVWMLSIPVALWLIFAAAFRHGSWLRVVAAIIVGWIAKNVFYRGFVAHRDRVGMEARLLTAGVAPQKATELAYAAMNGNADALALAGALIGPPMAGSGAARVDLPTIPAA